MKAPKFLYPALLLTAGLAFGLIGCRSDGAEQPVTELTPETSHLTTIPPAPETPPSASEPGVASATSVVTTVAAPATPATNAPAPALATTNALPGTNAPALATTPSTSGENAGAPTAQVGPQLPALPEPVREVVEMARSNVGESVLLEFVKNSSNPFDIKPEEIVYLKDIGVPETVVTAMIKRTAELRSQGVAAESATSTAQGAAPAEQPPAVPADQSAYATTVTPTAETAPPPPVAPPPVTENYYYSALSPYGSWLYLQPYGWCWQPTVAVVETGWRPYCHGGRWIYTSSGWYWQSSYSWGWAPFHYGNWYLNPACGWVWVPGSVWAPAWVTWRYSDAYCGWAPLPPGCGWSTGVGLTYYGSGVSVGFSFGLSWPSYTFVDWGHCWGPRPYHYYVPRHQTAVVYNNTTVINNYYGGGKTVINHGIPTTKMPTYARQEIHRAELKDISPNNRAPVRPEQASLEGNKVAVYRPRVPSDLKADSSKRMDPPYAPVRSRSELPALTRSDFGSSRGPLETPNRNRGTTVPYRTPDRSGTLSRPGPSTYTTPNRGSLQRQPAPASPTRPEPRPPQTSAPTRLDRGAPAQPYSSPSRSPGFSSPQTPPRIETPSAPSRGGNYGSPTAPSRGAPPSPPSSPTSRNNTTRYAPYTPPARFAEAYRPAYPARDSSSFRAVPAYSPPPRSSVPSFAPSQPRGSTVPTRSFNNPAPPRPSFSSPPAMSSPTPRAPSMSPSRSPSFASPQRSAPSGSAPTRGRFDTQ